MLGDSGAEALFDKDYPRARAGQHNGIGAWHWTCATVGAGAILGRHEDAAAQLPALEHFLSLGTRVAWGLGLTTRYAGIAATCGGDWTRAEQFFESAMAEAGDLPHQTEQVEVRMWYAWALQRNGDEVNQVQALIGDARTLADSLGMQAYVEQLSSVLGLTTA